MTELKEILSRSFTVNNIDTWYSDNFKNRKGLGLSQIGHECKRWLWYKYNNYDSIPPNGRTLRLFKLGESIENLLYYDL